MLQQKPQKLPLTQSNFTCEKQRVMHSSVHRTLLLYTNIRTKLVDKSEKM